MLAEHRDVVSIHEFFTGLDWGRRFPPGLVSGDDLADVIGAEQPVTTARARRGYTSDEIQYPFGSPSVRYQLGDPVPWLLITMLSRLTDDPDPLFDELLTFARSRPPSTIAEHYRAVFAGGSRRRRRIVWIERSGSSIDYLGDLPRALPRRPLRAHPSRRPRGGAVDPRPRLLPSRRRPCSWTCFPRSTMTGGQ